MTIHFRRVRPPRYVRTNKYNAQKTVVDGITFDSAKEAKRWGELKLLEKAGKIRNLERQKPLSLVLSNGTPILTPTGRTMVYRPDFIYFEGNKRILEDSKGFKDKVSMLKIAIVKAIYGIEVRLT